MGCSAPIEGAPGAPPDPGSLLRLETPSSMEFAILRTRWLKEHLEGNASIRAERNHFTTGAEANLMMTLRFPGPGSLTLLGGSDGILMELGFLFRRWPLFGGWEEMKIRRVFKVEAPSSLTNGGTWDVPIRFLLDLPSDPSSVWEAMVQVRARLGGANFNGQELPLQTLEFSGGEFQVLPLGWEPMAEDPLGNLEMALSGDGAQGDRWVLCSCALVEEEDKEEALGLLVGSLDTLPDSLRVAAAISALRFLSKEDAGAGPQAWKEWWEHRTMSNGASPR
jgi:hypothetical protein